MARTSFSEPPLISLVSHFSTGKRMRNPWHLIIPAQNQRVLRKWLAQSQKLLWSIWHRITLTILWTHFEIPISLCQFQLISMRAFSYPLVADSTQKLITRADNVLHSPNLGVGTRKCNTSSSSISLDEWIHSTRDIAAKSNPAMWITGDISWYWFWF